MVNYQQGKIYKIIDNTNGNVYIGSTCKATLAQRLSQHNASFKRYAEKSVGNNYASYDILKNGDYKIILIELYPCDTKDQLRAREQYWIENTECINNRCAFLSPEEHKQYDKQYYQQNKDRIKEYYEENKEHIIEQHKNYYEENKQTILEKNKEYNEKNKLKIKKRKQNYYNKNREQILEAKRLYSEQHKDRKREYDKQYYQMRKLKLQEQDEAKSES
jgi:hypothetical protein